MFDVKRSSHCLDGSRVTSVEFPVASDGSAASGLENAKLTRWLNLARLVAALILTPAVLIYAWGRVLVFGMFRAAPEGFFVGELVVGISTVILLTAGLSARLRSPRLDRWVIGGVPSLWVIVTSTIQC